MATDQKLTQLSSATVSNDTDLHYVVQGGISRKITKQLLMASTLGVANAAQSTASSAASTANSAASAAATADGKAVAAQADATQALSDAAAAQSDATQALSDSAAAQSDATQALSDAAAADAKAVAAQSDATQALSDAATADSNAVAAQADATQALSDAATADAKAVAAQSDATQALSDAATADANADTRVPKAIVSASLPSPFKLENPQNVGSFASPITGNITVDLANATYDGVAIVYHQSGTEPTITVTGGTARKFGGESYDTTNVNIIVIYWNGGTNVGYSYLPEQ